MEPLPTTLTVAAVTPVLRQSRDWFADAVRALPDHAADRGCLVDLKFYTSASERSDSRVLLAGAAWDVAADAHFAGADLLLFDFPGTYPLFEALLLRPRGVRTVVAWHPDHAADWDAPGVPWRLVDRVLVTDAAWHERLNRAGAGDVVLVVDEDAFCRAALAGVTSTDRQLRDALAQARGQFLRNFARPAPGT